jgi:hypothetical protein
VLTGYAIEPTYVYYGQALYSYAPCWRHLRHALRWVLRIERVYTCRHVLYWPAIRWPSGCAGLLTLRSKPCQRPGHTVVVMRWRTATCHIPPVLPPDIPLSGYMPRYTPSQPVSVSGQPVHCRCQVTLLAASCAVLASPVISCDIRCNYTICYAAFVMYRYVQLCVVLMRCKHAL